MRRPLQRCYELIITSKLLAIESISGGTFVDLFVVLLLHVPTSVVCDKVKVLEGDWQCLPFVPT